MSEYAQPPQGEDYSLTPSVHGNVLQSHTFPPTVPLPDLEAKPPLTPLLPTDSTAITIIAEPQKGAAAFKRPPMRSSIACIRCRRSKIKCDNDGKASSPCETCIKSGRECQYPVVNTPTLRRAAEPQTPLSAVSPTAGPAAFRHDDGPADRGHERKRLKKLEDACGLDSPYHSALYADEVLSAPYLTETMWMQVCNIYCIHFATELPFLHLPTLKETMGTSFITRQRRRSADTNLVLLGVLTLTSRFHSDLVKYVAQTIANQSCTKGRPPLVVKADPWAASEYYSDVLTKALGPLNTSMTLASTERVQAFLMLGLYDWSQTKRKTGGLGAWMYVGVAIRMAQALGLCFDGRPGDRQYHMAAVASSSAVNSETDTAERWACRSGEGNDTSRRDPAKASAPPTDIIVQGEIRRRTMYSCLILDRLLSCGKERLPAICSEDIQIQLPCTDFDFASGKEVHTRYLKSPKEDKTAGNEQETREDSDSVLARFVQLVDIWGDISKYSFAGGRLAEKRPPWEETEFRRLRGLLANFYESLPSRFTLSRNNYYIYEGQQACSTYVSLHMLGSVCKIMLHREYIPFIPIRCKGPEGPLDEPKFAEGSAPPGFWEESAEQVFKPARDIVDLINICQGCGKLPMSALVVFSIWTAAFVGIYAWHFPLLDTKRHMLPDVDGGQNAMSACGTSNKPGIHVQNYGPTGTVYSTLKKMSTWLQMACTYVGYFQEMNKFYEGVKDDYRKRTGKLSFQQDGGGGGLDEWKVHGPKVTNNGTILSNEDALVEGSDRSRTSSTPAGLDPSSDRSRTSSTPAALDPGSDRSRTSSTPTGLDRGPYAGPDGISTSYMPIYSHRSCPAIGHHPVPVPVAVEEHADMVAMGTPGVGCDDGVYMSQDDGSFPGSGGTMSAHGLSISGEAGLEQSPASLQPWEQYSHEAQQQLDLQMPHGQQMSVSSQGYQMEDQGGYTDMRIFYPEVLTYIDRNQGLRWQDASQAAGIKHFCHGDAMGGHAMWTDQHFGTF